MHIKRFKFQHINGKLVKDGEAAISPNDMGFLRSYAVFDYFNIQNGVPVFIDEHIDRFYNSAEAVGLVMPYAKDVTRNYIFEFIDCNKVNEGGIRLVLTGGVPDNETQIAKPNFLIQGAFLPVLDESKYKKGLTLITHNFQREFPEVKTTNYLTWKWLEPRIKAAGAFDVLYYSEGKITETSRGNFFMVGQNNVLVTPEKMILKGVTRSKILKIAKDHYKIQKRDILLSELKTAREVFITSSSKSIMAITKVDDQVIGDGLTGNVAAHLDQLYKEEVSKYLKKRQSHRK